MIDDERQARELARAMVSDVRLYGENDVIDSDDPTSPTMLEDARSTFCAKVHPRLHGVFEEERAR